VQPGALARAAALKWKPTEGRKSMGIIGLLVVIILVILLLRLL